MSSRGLDRIRFAVSAVPFDRVDLREGEDAVFAFVNGRDLIGIVHEFERPLAVSAGFSPTCHYAPPRASDVLPPSGHWLGSPAPGLSFGDRAVVFTCACGAWGCGGLLARIAVDDDVVVWSGFESPYSLEWMAELPDRPVEGDISREGLGPFRFDRRQYEAALLSPQRIAWPYESPSEPPSLEPFSA